MLRSRASGVLSEVLRAWRLVRPAFRPAAAVEPQGGSLSQNNGSEEKSMSDHCQRFRVSAGTLVA
ncbi:hypothetical protein [Actinocorallia libanotica]|uniref:hypothetical protein n=1 Tax=Actinocorallia libanotica TaxID=46162 RepID=UPI0031D89DCF